MARIGKITVDLDVNVNGCSPVPEHDSVVDDHLALPLDAVAELHRHANDLTRTFRSPAMTAVLRELLTDLDARLAGDERRLRMEFGRLNRRLDEVREYWSDDLKRRLELLDAAAVIVAELERRNKRSGAKPSPELKRAAKLVADQVSELEDASA